MPTSHGGHIFISKIVYFQHKSAKKIDFRWKFKYNYSVLLFLSKAKLLKWFRQRLPAHRERSYEYRVTAASHPLESEKEK